METRVGRTTFVWRLWLLACCAGAALSACRDLDLIGTVDKCQGEAVSEECPQCLQPPYAPECSQCQYSGDPNPCEPPVEPEPDAGVDAGDAAVGGSAGTGQVVNPVQSGGAGGASGVGGGVAGASAVAAGASGMPTAGMGQPAGCKNNNECSGENRGCRTDTGKCVPCTENAHCAGDRVCDKAINRCVECTEDKNCEAKGGGHCFESTCVACTDNDHCSDARLHVCNAEHTCVECLTPADCAMGLTCLAQQCVECETHDQCRQKTQGTKPFCEPEQHACVECLDDFGCPQPGAPRCVQNACAPCDQSAQCARLTNTPLCDVEAKPAMCVHCLEGQGCGEGTCILGNRTCSTVRPRSRGACDECEADAQCAAGYVCVELTAPNAPVAKHCVRTASTGACTRPYSRLLRNQRSVDGRMQDVCAPSATTNCKAVQDMMAKKPCNVDSECGWRMGDARCNVPGTGANRCTYICRVDDDCPSSAQCDDGFRCL